MSKLTVAVIEDDPKLSMALTLELRASGLEVVQKFDGESGLEAIILQHPDLILLDIILPKMDGIGLLTKLRLDPWGKNAKVIMLTNLSDAEKISSAVESDIIAYLIKTDVSVEDIAEKVKVALGI